MTVAQRWLSFLAVPSMHGTAKLIDRSLVTPALACCNTDADTYGHTFYPVKKNTLFTCCLLSPSVLVQGFGTEFVEILHKLQLGSLGIRALELVPSIPSLSSLKINASLLGPHGSLFVIITLSGLLMVRIQDVKFWGLYRGSPWLGNDSPVEFLICLCQSWELRFVVRLHKRHIYVSIGVETEKRNFIYYAYVVSLWIHCKAMQCNEGRTSLACGDFSAWPAAAAVRASPLSPSSANNFLSFVRAAAQVGKNQ